MQLLLFRCKEIFGTQLLSRNPRFFSSKPPKWNSRLNLNMIITHPTLLLIESCNSMPQLKQLQANMIRTGLISHMFPISRLLSFSALDPNGDICYADVLFSQVANPNLYIWNTMIRGYARSQFPEMALCYFNRMLRECIEMDKRSYVFLLKGSEMLSGIHIGSSVHCRIWKTGFVYDLIVRNSLMHFYSEKGHISDAEKVFHESSVRDVVSWTSMIDGFVQKNMADEALEFFVKMRSSGLEPNEVTMITVFSACSLKGDLILARCIHEFVERSGLKCSQNLMNAMLDMHIKCGDLGRARKIFYQMDVKDVFSWTSMINGYARNGEVDFAKKCFDEMPERNAVSWTALIACFSQNNNPKEALETFHQMEMEGTEPIESTLVCVLSACSQLGCLDMGQRVHDFYIKKRFVPLSLIIGNALIDMYAKCGRIDAALEIFDQMSKKDVVSFNSMIVGYASHGHAYKVLILFEQMKSIGFMPDDITFVGVLSACAHAGLIKQGWEYFGAMKLHGLKPAVEHYACMIDLLSRVGHLKEAYELIESMPVQPDVAVWGALLNGCAMHGNLDLGKLAAAKLLVLDPKDSGIYTLLASLCAKGKKWSDVRLVRSMMRENGTKKNPGYSFIEVEGKFHEFLAADETHLQSKAIYEVVYSIFLLSKSENYGSHVDDAVHFSSI